MIAPKLQNGNKKTDLEVGRKASFILMALYDPVSKKLLVLIKRKGKATVTDIYNEIKLDQAVVAQHLAILRRAGIVKTERDGKRILYSVNDERVTEITNLARNLVSEETQSNYGHTYLLKRPKTEPVKLQIQKQWKVKGSKNHLSEIIGKWPGNESFEKLSKMLGK